MASNMKNSIFEYDNYKEFLISRVGPRQSRQGVRKAIASFLNCQPTYISQVLYKTAHFSMEHAERLSQFFHFTPEETHFFLLLLQKERAGTKNLENYFAKQLDSIRIQRLNLTKRLGKENALSKKERSLYYSSWHYSAIHMACTIPEWQSIQKLCAFLKIPKRRISEIIEDLVQMGLIEKKGDSVQAKINQIRIGVDSSFISRHHTNWRLQAIAALERETFRDFHYSAVATVSQADVIRIKNQFLDFVSSLVQEIRKSKEEELYAINLDFFNMKNDT